MQNLQESMIIQSRATLDRIIYYKTLCLACLHIKCILQHNNHWKVNICQWVEYIKQQMNNVKVNILEAEKTGKHKDLSDFDEGHCDG